MLDVLILKPELTADIDEVLMLRDELIAETELLVFDRPPDTVETELVVVLKPELIAEIELVLLLNEPLILETELFVLLNPVETLPSPELTDDTLEVVTLRPLEIDEIEDRAVLKPLDIAPPDLTSHPAPPVFGLVELFAVVLMYVVSPSSDCISADNGYPPVAAANAASNV